MCISHEIFIRRFKAYLGLTPSQVRADGTIQ